MRNANGRRKRTELMPFGRLYVTIDTEMDADIHWKKGRPEAFTSVLEGIPKLLRPIWDRCKICPIYFVSPEVVKNDECCRVLREEIDKGAIIGAHLHPEYIEPDTIAPAEVEREVFPCRDLDRNTEYIKMKNLRDIIEERLGVRSVWYRAARFGADTESLKMLAELGFKADSSFTPQIDWSDRGGVDHSSVRIGRQRIDCGEGKTITEFPVTIKGKRFGILRRLLPDNWLFYRWVRPTHMTYIEERWLLRELRKEGIKDIVMMFHSMEVMVGKTPYVRNRLMQKYYLFRLEKTAEYARKLGYVSYREKQRRG